MYSLSRPIRSAALAMVALALTGCASTNVSSYLERENDFSRYRTYSWAPDAALETGDARLDSNPFFHERIQADVEQQLARRGFEKMASASGMPDVLIRYRASVRQRVETNGIDPEYGYCKNDDGCPPFIYEAGTLLIDFVDTRTDHLVWRGWAEDSFEGVIDNQRLMEQSIDRAVTRILQRLPPQI